MGRTQLKALLSSGASSIVFDVRPREDNHGAAEKLPPFFDLTLLRNVILMKTVEPDEGLQTRLYVPFDGNRACKGGASLITSAAITRRDLEAFFGAKLDDRCETDVKKLQILSRTPSFCPFLLRDAFERAGVAADTRYFRVSDAEAAEMQNTLKARLKPLAAMALSLSPTAVGDSRLDLLARKLWELNDPNFLKPLAAALKIPDGETAEVLYAWIGTSFFQREFAKRQSNLKRFAEWLTVRANEAAEHDTDARNVRERVRQSWSAAGSIFTRYSTSYDALITKADAKPFVDYLEGVRADFLALGAHMSVIDQCLCLFDVIAGEVRGSQAGLELLRDLAAGMRDSGDRAAA
ncbi:MAG: hypothetical protein KBA31_08785 [Alphaproteobacteria bacterium]|nr:hypothetical protein [Alphaproteobacteria bacterium]